MTIVYSLTQIYFDINVPIKQIAVDLRRKYALKIPDLTIPCM